LRFSNDRLWNIRCLCHGSSLHSASMWSRTSKRSSSGRSSKAQHSDGWYGSVSSSWFAIDRADHESIFEEPEPALCHFVGRVVILSRIFCCTSQLSSSLWTSESKVVAVDTEENDAMILGKRCGAIFREIVGRSQMRFCRPCIAGSDRGRYCAYGSCVTGVHTLRKAKR
jgi:hypothetical protein